jgi:hypothetical protein
MRDDTTTDRPSYLLASLDELEDFKIADGCPDPRGWDVLAADGRTVGKVDSLIADPGAMKVRYLDVDLDEKALGLEKPRHVLIPIGGAVLHEKDDAVYVGAIPSTLKMLPPYEHTTLTRHDEQFYLQHFDAAYAPSEGETDFYALPHFDDSRFFGRRRRDDKARYLTRC